MAISIGAACNTLVQHMLHLAFFRIVRLIDSYARTGICIFYVVCVHICVYVCMYASQYHLTSLRVNVMEVIYVNLTKSMSGWEVYNSEAFAKFVLKVYVYMYIHIYLC